MIYVMSDDYYFSLGIKEVFLQENQHINVIPYLESGTISAVEHLDDEDIILLAVESMTLLQEITLILAMKKTRACLFLKNISSYNRTEIQNGILPRSISLYNLISGVSEVIIADGLRKITGSLTHCQYVVLNKTAKGNAVGTIAQTLGVSEKMIYNHRREGLKKLGLAEMNCRAILIYICLAQFGREYIIRNLDELCFNNVNIVQDKKDDFSFAALSG